MNKIRMEVQDLCRGMYVCELDRPWVETSFLFQGFRITSDEELSQLERTCEYVFVDVEKSAASVVPGGRGLARQAPAASAVKKPRRRVRPPCSADFEDEFPVAKAIFQEAADTVHDMFEDVRMGRTIDAGRVRDSVAAIADSIIRHPDALKLLCAIRDQNRMDVSHALHVCILSLALGRHLGLPTERLYTLGVGGLLHDVGEIRVPEEIRAKGGVVSDEERDHLNRHTDYGVEILKKSKGIPETAVAIARDHHERNNGSGFPRQLEGEEIGHFTKIVSIVDVYDSVTSGLESKPVISFTDALKSMYDWRDDLFDGELVEQFIQCLGIYPVGSVVSLKSGEIGIVIALDEKTRLTPKIMLLRDAEAKPYEPPRIINLAQFRGNDETHRYEVRCVVHPEDYDIDVRRYILRELYADRDPVTQTGTA
ncbi:MAG: DUF3391 domain-containing protein [Pseudomonadota bacterium]|nr:MAG: DUF3391 domain-containing protein [Pseudomonadota bacterium]